MYSRVVVPRILSRALPPRSNPRNQHSGFRSRRTFRASSAFSTSSISSTSSASASPLASTSNPEEHDLQQHQQQQREEDKEDKDEQPQEQQSKHEQPREQQDVGDHTKPHHDTPITKINPHNNLPTSHLNPMPDDYTMSAFSDRASLTLHAGPGGNGCISFLRDMHFGGDGRGPPNGGDGGHGGNIYIKAAYGETSLHKVGRRRVVRASRGVSGLGSSKDGTRGADVVLTVPVGTVIRELWRNDPVGEEMALARERRAQRRAENKTRAAAAAAAALQTLKEGHLGEENAEEIAEQARKAQEQKDWEEYEYPHFDKWVFYPGISSSEKKNVILPKLPKRDRLFPQPAGPLALSLMEPTEKPILVAAGGLGGWGNTHFVKERFDRPYIASKGEKGVTISLELELKLLADVGFVGLPNAGKSTLLRALTNSRARIGSWAFTTLQPNIGTVVLDNYHGRAMALPKPRPRFKPLEETWGLEVEEDQEPRTRFTIADIPGLIEGAHLDKGLGIEFLRHVERAGVLAFVIDLSAGPAVDALQALWREVGLYAKMREEETRQREIERRIEWEDEHGPKRANMFSYSEFDNMEDALADDMGEQPENAELGVAMKPWFVIATKGDLEGTKGNFQELKYYLDGVTRGEFGHPSGVEGAWREECAVVPVSAINGHGMDRIVHWAVGLLDR